MAKGKKPLLWNESTWLKLGEAQVEKLDRLVEESGLNQADVVRLLIDGAGEFRAEAGSGKPVVVHDRIYVNLAERHVLRLRRMQEQSGLSEEQVLRQLIEQADKVVARPGNVMYERKVGVT